MFFLGDGSPSICLFACVQNLVWTMCLALCNANGKQKKQEQFQREIRKRNGNGSDSSDMEVGSDHIFVFGVGRDVCLPACLPLWCLSNVICVKANFNLSQDGIFWVDSSFLSRHVIH